MNLQSDLVRHYRWLRQFGINDSHSGNMSVRDGSSIWITPTGACADTLDPEELVHCTIGEKPASGASLDAPLHLAVYARSPQTQSVIHSHGPYTVGTTLDGNDFAPPDFEGQLYFPTVPVLTISYERYLEESPDQVARILAEHPIMVVKGHGVYAAAKSLNLAYKWTCSLEHSAKTAFIAALARVKE